MAGEAAAAAPASGDGTGLETALEPRSLEGRFVEIHSLEHEVEAQDCLLGFLGETVDANGRRGVAHWDDDRREYAVATLEGFFLTVPAANLRESKRVGPQAGGRDLEWPGLSLARAGASFGARLAEVLLQQSYCLIQMPEADDGERSSTTEAAQAREDYERPPQELEEAYLGRGHSSKVSWLDGSESLVTELGSFGQRVADLSHCLLPAAQLLSFRMWPYRCGSLLRRPLAGQAEREALGREPLGPGDAEGGLLEQHLDFLQRRRLCLMYFIESQGGTVELFPRDAQDGGTLGQAATLHVAKDQLLVFRHDLLGYCYKPEGQEDLVLQTWLLEEPQQLRLDGFEGSRRGMEAIYGGPSQDPDVQVHVMSAACRFPAMAHGLERLTPTFAAQTDGFIYPPLTRWDHSLYYEDESEQFGSGGKCGTKHCAFLSDDELICFDNAFFGISPEDAKMLACAQRNLFEMSYEAWAAVGYTLKSLLGANIFVGIGDQSLDSDLWRGYRDDPKAWAMTFNTTTYSSVARLAHVFGLTGPMVAADTACSSSLVSANLAHAALRQREKGVREALSMGLMQITSPFTFIGLSAAGMLGRGGRCKTFDDAANGYNRGEGTGGLSLKVSDDLEATHDRIACFVSGFINQDGRSASLTAPNGPSQQQCIRSSLRQAGLGVGDLAATENHGTGTALGDPIETGSICAVFRRRDAPLPITSGKSHIGHLEATAGSVGLLKLLCTLTMACVPSNVHLRRLNGNIDPDGCQGLIPVEDCDLETEYHYAGANSFGFGGTNSRAELWARRLHRQRRTPGESLGRRLRMDMLGSCSNLPQAFDRLDMIAVSCPRCLGPMCWLCGAAAPDAGGRGRHRCSSVRAEAASYKLCSLCYTGGYLHQGGSSASSESAGADFGRRLFLKGTWNAWGTPLEMQRVAGGLEADVWEAELCLGDARQELFHLVAEMPDSSKAVLHPLVKRAGQRVRAAGPAADAKGRHWLIDGFRDGVAAGTVYRIRFDWSTERKRISWTPLDFTRTPSFQHQYCLASSLTGWVPFSGFNSVMYPVPGEEAGDSVFDLDDPVLWSWQRGRLPASGKVELTFMRDFDQSQIIYPLEEHPRDTSVPVMGPDEGGSGRRWLAWGKPGERLSTSIRVADGEILVRIVTETMGDRVWRSRPGGGQAYQVTGSFNDWTFSEMQADASTPDVYIARFAVGDGGCEEFKIVVNQNWHMAMYPGNNGDSPGVGLLCGPDRKGAKRNWRVEGYPGQEHELRLDLGAEDHCEMVTCRPCSML